MLNLYKTQSDNCGAEYVAFMIPFVEQIFMCPIERVSNRTFQLAELVRMTKYSGSHNCAHNIISINLLQHFYLLQTFLIHISARKCGNDTVVQQHKEDL